MHRRPWFARAAAIAAIFTLSVCLPMASGRAAAPGETADPAATKPAIPVDCPIGLAVNTHDELFVANNSGGTSICGGTRGQILVFNKDGVQLTTRNITAGLGTGSTAGLAFDAHDNLFVSIYQQHLVRVFSPAGKQLPTQFLRTDPNYNPSGVQIDRAGDVWVANRTNSNITIGEIEIFHKGRVIDTITEGLVYPLGIVFQARTGNAWVGNSETPGGNSFAVFSGTGRFLDIIRTSGFTPGYLAFAKNGRLYATGPLSSQIEIFSASGRRIGPAITAGLNLPYGIAFDREGDFFVANVGSGTITKYTPAGKLICTITKTGCR